MSDTYSGLGMQAKLIHLAEGISSDFHCQWQLKDIDISLSTVTKVNPMLYYTVDGGIVWDPMPDVEAVDLVGEPIDMVAFNFDASSFDIPEQAIVGLTLNIDVSGLNEYRRLSIDSSDAVFLRFDKGMFVSLGKWPEMGPQTRIINCFRGKHKKVISTYFDVICHNGQVMSKQDIRLYVRSFNKGNGSYPNYPESVSYKELTDFEVLLEEPTTKSSVMMNRSMIKMDVEPIAGDVYIIQHVANGDTTRPIAGKFNFPGDLSGGFLTNVKETLNRFFYDETNEDKYVIKSKTYDTTVDYGFIEQPEPLRDLLTLIPENEGIISWVGDDLVVSEEVISERIKSYYAYSVYSSPGVPSLVTNLSKNYVRNRNGVVNFTTPGNWSNDQFGCMTKAGKGLEKSVEMYSFDDIRLKLERENIEVIVNDSHL